MIGWGILYLNQNIQTRENQRKLRIVMCGLKLIRNFKIDLLTVSKGIANAISYIRVSLMIWYCTDLPSMMPWYGRDTPWMWWGHGFTHKKWNIGHDTTWCIVYFELSGHHSLPSVFLFCILSFISPFIFGFEELMLLLEIRGWQRIHL